MSTTSKIGAIADDVLTQCETAGLFAAAALGTTGDAVATFAYAYEMDLRTLDDDVHVVMAPMDYAPLRTAWGGQQRRHHAGIAILKRVTDIDDRATIDPLLALGEGICNLLMDAKDFDTTANCTQATMEAGDLLNDSLKQHNLFFLPIDCVFEEQVVTT